MKGYGTENSIAAVVLVTKILKEVATQNRSRSHQSKTSGGLSIYPAPTISDTGETLLHGPNFTVASKTSNTRNT